MAAVIPGSRPVVLVTRPAGAAADRLAGSLRQAGYGVTQQPLLQLHAVDKLAGEQRQCLLDLDRFQHVIFISANAVRFGMARVADFWPQLPVGVLWYAIGEATADLLRTWDIEAITPGSRMSSEGLLALPQLAAVAGERVLIIKGRGGRGLLADELRQRGARVSELACYTRTPRPLDGADFAAELEAAEVEVALISSGEGLQHLAELLSPAESSNFRQLCLIVPSRRVARLAREAGFNRVVIAENASDAAVLYALEQWISRSGEISSERARD